MDLRPLRFPGGFVSVCLGFPCFVFFCFDLIFFGGWGVPKESRPTFKWEVHEKGESVCCKG